MKNKRISRGSCCFTLLAWAMCHQVPSAWAAQASVNIVDFAFDPASVTINVNDSVLWTWVGPTVHTATSTTGLWDSGIMSAAAPQFTHTFTSSGSFPYFCAVHPFMTASVTVTPSAPSGADIGIDLTAAPNPVVISNQLTYTVTINNSGPADAPDVLTTGSLPTNVSFISGSASQGNLAQTANGWRWDAGPLANGAHATASVVVLPLVQGDISASGSVSLNSPSVTDPNSGNNSASLITSVTTSTSGGSTNTSVQVQVLGPVVLDPQTGLFEQSVRLSNRGSNSVPALRLAVLSLPADVTLYNASGATNGSPFVEYDQTLAAGGSVDLVLEYYRSNRVEFVATNFQVTPVGLARPAPPGGTIVQLDRDPFLFNGMLVIEFASVPGRTYVVEYSPDMQTWSVAVPPVTAAGTRLQWVDAGPPKTASPPGAPGQRFYRVVQLP